MKRIGIPLESFNLDEREFNRCKNWATIIKRYSTIDSSIELNLEDLDSEYAAVGNDEEDETDDDSTEVCLEDEENEPQPFDESVVQLRNFSSTLIHRKPSHTYSKFSGAKILSSLPEKDEEESSDEEESQLLMQSMLDQTIPQLKERNRKWEESGMLRVLNTFDKENIERTVGSWLRNNKCNVQPEKLTQLCAPEPDDEDDSLHSIDTARYVLSNRKPRKTNKCCNSMAIKTYRMVQSKRDALREKYSIPEEDLKRIAEKSKHKLRPVSDISREWARFIKTNKVGKECGARQTPRTQQGSLLRIKKALKHRDRRCVVNICSWSSTSSEDMDTAGCDSDQIRKNLRDAQLRRFKDPAHLTSSSFKSPAMHTSKSDTQVKTFYKARKRESECCCYNQEKLCHYIDHLADISTEEWLVENCDTPEESVPTEMERKSDHFIKKSKLAPKLRAGSARKTSTKKKKPELNSNNKKLIKKSVVSKADDDKRKNEPQLENTFDREMELARQLSLQSYKAEKNTMKRKIHETNDMKTKKVRSKENPKVINEKNTRAKVKDDDNSAEVQCAQETTAKESLMSIKNNIFPSASGKASSCEKEAKVENVETNGGEVNKSTKTPKSKATSHKSGLEKSDTLKNETLTTNKTAKRNKSVTLLTEALTIDDISPMRFGIKPQPKSLKIKKVKKILEESRNAIKNEDNTFFVRADKIWNSTAFPNDTTAFQNQVPTAPHDPSESNHLKIPDNITTTKNTNVDGAMSDDSDCFLVTSTTEEPQTHSPAAATVANNSNNSIRRRREDILIYTPRCRDLAPANSVSDGVLNITEEHLSTFIGKKSARKFWKYYIGRRRFDANLTVYYRPPPNESFNADNDTASDLEELEQLNRYGELHASFEEGDKKL